MGDCHVRVCRLAFDGNNNDNNDDDDSERRADM